MANPQSSEKSPHGQRINIASLLSPPEQTSESFGPSMAPTVPTPSSSFNSTTPQSKMGAVLKTWHASEPEFPVYVSPPISPYDPLFRRNSVEPQPENRTVDPQLFPEDSNPAALATMINQPLFPQEAKDARSARHQPTKSDTRAQAKVWPKSAVQSPKNAVQLRSTVFEKALKNPRAWMLQERQWDNYYGQPAKSKKRPAVEPLAPAPAAPTRLSKRPKREPVLPGPSQRVLRSQSDDPLTPPLEAIELPEEPVEELLEKPKKARQPKATPKKAEVDASKAEDPSAKEDTKSGGDNQYWTVEDITVPVSAMPQDRYFLKPNYVANTPRDPSDDPAVEMLHPSEFNLCLKMRIPADVYITTKRRIFLRRLEHLKLNKKFSKTHAQMCTHIDVTKASALWSTFNSAGWLDPELYKEHLKPKKPATGPTPNGLEPPRAVV